MILDDDVVDEIEATMREALKVAGPPRGSTPQRSSHDQMQLHRRLTRCIEFIEARREQLA